MAKRGSGEVGTLVNRAMAGRDKRYIYNGERATAQSNTVLRPNKPATRRRYSTFNIILALFSVGIAIVLYVNNIITINRLSFETNQLRTRYDTIMNANAALRADVSRKAAWERIGKAATDQLGLKFATEQAVLFDVDESNLDALTVE